MKERIFTAHELKVWNERFGEYDMSKIIRLKRQYILANSHGLPKTSEEVEAIRIWSYYTTILRTGEPPKAKLSVRQQITRILESQDYFELSQIDAEKGTVFKVVHDLNSKLKGERLQPYYQSGSVDRKAGINDKIVGYRLVRKRKAMPKAESSQPTEGSQTVEIEPTVERESKLIEPNQRLSSNSTVKSALYGKVYEHFSGINKAVLNANDLAAFNNQSVVIRVIEDLGYRFSPNAANWHLRVSA